LNGGDPADVAVGIVVDILTMIRRGEAPADIIMAAGLRK
jgi:hypothetical protein